MSSRAAIDEIAQLDSFFVQQKFAFMLNSYTISRVGPDGGSPSEPLAYVRQKRMKIREQINFYRDESQTQPLMRIQAKKVFEFRGRSEVQLPDGTVVGYLQKVFGTSLVRSTWQLLDPNGNVVPGAQESSMLIAVLRRVWGFLPYLGSVPFLLPFHFDVTMQDRTVGTYRRIWSWRDRYVMDLTGDPERRIDRRVAMAFCIALDTLQDR